MALWLLKSILRYLFCGDSWEHAFTVTDLIYPTSHILGYEIEPLISLSEQLNSPSEQSNSLPVAKGVCNKRNNYNFSPEGTAALTSTVAEDSKRPFSASLFSPFSFLSRMKWKMISSTSAMPIVGTVDQYAVPWP